MTANRPPDAVVSEPPNEPRVLLIPPTRRDGEAICKLLQDAGIICEIYPTMDELCAALAKHADVVVLSEEAVFAAAEGLAVCVAAQPVWSDLPVLILSRAGAESPRFSSAISKLGNVSVVERPVRISTLLSLVHSAIRARRRQYEVREHLANVAQAEILIRESESRFRLMADSIPHLAWSARGDGSIYWYNKRWYEYTGKTFEQMQGWGWQDVHDPAVLPNVLERWTRSLTIGESFEMEFPLRGADGQYRTFLTRVAPLRNDEGVIVQWFGTNTDVTDQRRAAEEREQLLQRERDARAEAERAGRIKDEFLATLSHELRTPLNAILGWSQIIHGGDCDPADIAEGMEVIERNARAQTQIIEDLLDMSRIISGKMHLDVKPIDLAAVVRAAADTVGTAATAKGIRLQMILDPLKDKISGDPNRLQQVFWNLLSNAIKFTTRGGSVQVVLERVRSHLEVSVTDSGEGIDAEFMPHVFDRFRQADGATTRMHGGLGLGLAIVKQLVELHGGTIRAQSAGRGRGSTFTVALPIALLRSAERPHSDQHVAHAQSLSSPEPHELLGESADLRGLRIVIVDDEADARTLLRRLLQERNATVLVAASAKEAFELLSTQKPDLLISDIGMPGEDGYSLIRRIRSHADRAIAETPAIALTAYARSQDRVQSLHAGFQHHLSKPVEPAELIALIAQLSAAKSS